MCKNETYQQHPLPEQQLEQFERNHLVTTKGVVRCRFELFIRWPDNAGRKINPFTQRGDKYEKEDSRKMFHFLLQYFINRHHQWLMAELYDNTHPLEDPKRIILQLKNKNGNLDKGKDWISIDLRDKIVHHRLHEYKEMLKGLSLPAWLGDKLI